MCSGEGASSALSAQTKQYQGRRLKRLRQCRASSASSLCFVSWCALLVFGCRCRRPHRTTIGNRTGERLYWRRRCFGQLHVSKTSKHPTPSEDNRVNLLMSLVDCLIKRRCEVVHPVLKIDRIVPNEARGLLE